jgi:hypothetical protein
LNPSPLPHPHPSPTWYSPLLPILCLLALLGHSTRDEGQAGLGHDVHLAALGVTSLQGAGGVLISTGSCTAGGVKLPRHSATYVAFNLYHSKCPDTVKLTNNHNHLASLCHTVLLPQNLFTAFCQSHQPNEPGLPLLCLHHTAPTLTYTNSGLTQRARLEGSVQGVVVQATREAPSASPSMGKDTITAGSSTCCR